MKTIEVTGRIVDTRHVERNTDLPVGKQVRMFMVVFDDPEADGELKEDTLLALARLQAEGVISWSGGKPRGLANPPRSHGGLVSDLVIEGRR